MHNVRNHLCSFPGLELPITVDDIFTEEDFDLIYDREKFNQKIKPLTNDGTFGTGADTNETLFGWSYAQTENLQWMYSPQEHKIPGSGRYTQTGEDIVLDKDQDNIEANINGNKIISGNPGVGVNPITFSDDDRLFVAQCFFDNGLFEMDPSGNTEPRIIFEEIGDFCGLNGMDWGSDGRLYGPRWFNNEVVSVDVDTGDIRKEVVGLNVPAAVKFNSKGELFILDTGAGKVVKVTDGIKSDYAYVELGLDNLAINSDDEVYVSSYSEGNVMKVSPGAIEKVLPGGISHAGGITISGDDIVVADIQSVKAYSTKNGSESWNIKNVFRVSPHGANTAVSSFDNYHSRHAAKRMTYRLT